MFRIKDLELRKTKTISKEEKQYLEIVKWEGSTCYTIANWETDKDGDFPSLLYCGDRPLQENIDKEVFDKLVVLGYDIYAFREVKDSNLL